MRTGEQFDLFWELMLLKLGKLDILESELPIKRKTLKGLR